MENLIDKLLSFFTSSTKNSEDKIFCALIIFYLFVFADYGFEFTKPSFISNKLNTLESIVNLKTAYKNDSLKIKYLNALETQTFNSKHYLESSSNNSLKNATNESLKYTTISSSIIIDYVFKLSCVLFLLPVLIFYFLCLLFWVKKPKIKEIVYFLIVVIIVKLIMSLNYYILVGFPIILDNVWYNIIFNSILTYLQAILLGKFLLPISKKLSIE